MKFIPWMRDSYSINFVDEDNKLIGYDYTKNCCEAFGFYIKDSEGVTLYRNSDETKLYPDEVNKIVADFSFTGKHYKEENACSGYLNTTVAFQATDGYSMIWVCFYNYHNGYYSHGFVFENGDEKLEDYV